MLTRFLIYQNFSFNDVDIILSYNKTTINGTRKTDIKIVIDDHDPSGNRTVILISPNDKAFQNIQRKSLSRVEPLQNAGQVEIIPKKFKVPKTNSAKAYNDGEKIVPPKSSNSRAEKLIKLSNSELANNNIIFKTIFKKPMARKSKVDVIKRSKMRVEAGTSGKIVENRDKSADCENETKNTHKIDKSKEKSLKSEIKEPKLKNQEPRKLEKFQKTFELKGKPQKLVKLSSSDFNKQELEKKKIIVKTIFKKPMASKSKVNVIKRNKIRMEAKSSGKVVEDRDKSVPCEEETGNTKKNDEFKEKSKNQEPRKFEKFQKTLKLKGNPQKVKDEAKLSKLRVEKLVKLSNLDFNKQELENTKIIIKTIFKKSMARKSKANVIKRNKMHVEAESSGKVVEDRDESAACKEKTGHTKKIDELKEKSLKSEMKEQQKNLKGQPQKIQDVLKSIRERMRIGADVKRFKDSRSKMTKSENSKSQKVGNRTPRTKREIFWMF